MKILKKISAKTDFIVATLSLVGIAIILNYFSYNFFWRWDLTKNGLYSISDVSKKTLVGLNDVVNVKVYFSNNLPSYYAVLRQDLKDILEEYSTYSKGKVVVEFVDLEKMQNPELELSKKGIPPLMIDVVEKDKRQAVKAFMGLSIQYGARNEVIPMVKDNGNLEYQITMAIKKVVKGESPKIAFVKSNDTASLDSELNGVRQVLSEIYSISEVDLSKDNIPADIKTLLVISPKKSFTEDDLKKMDKFVTSGGSLFLAVDGVKVDKNLVAEPNKLNLDKLLESYGLKLNKDLVADTNMWYLKFFNGLFNQEMKYPFFPVIVKDGFNKDYAAVSKLESLALLWASSIETVKLNNNESKVDFLAKTSQEAAVQKEGEYNIYPRQDFPSVDTESRGVVAFVSGKIKGPYGQSGNGRVVLVSDGDFVTNYQLSVVPANILFFQNVIDMLSYDSDLISIRSKDSTIKPIKELKDEQRVFYKYGNIFGSALLVLIAGVARYYFRRKRSNKSFTA